MTIDHPIHQPLLQSDTDPAWEQCLKLFQQHGQPEPPTRLRDELVCFMGWAWYGVEAAALLQSQAAEIERLKGKAEDLAEYEGNALNDRDTAQSALSEALEVVRFYADPETYVEPTIAEWREANPGKDPTTAIRCGRLSVEAKSGHALGAIHTDRRGDRARTFLSKYGREGK